MCHTLCCKCTIPNKGMGKCRSAIIAVDSPNAVIWAVNDGAVLCPTFPDAPSNPLYWSTNSRETTPSVSQRVPGSVTEKGFLDRIAPAATLAYEDVSDGISSTWTTRRFSGCGADSTMFGSSIIFLPWTVHTPAGLCR